jgi:Protein of unknown function (DUF3159)
MVASVVALAPLPSAAESLLEARPRIRDVVVRTSVSIVIACVVPALLFSTTMMTFSMTPALLAALAWGAGVVCWRAATKQRTSGLLVLTLLVLAVRTGFALATGSTFLYFLQPILANAVVAAVFLGSLLTARPAVSWLAADFFPMADDIADRPGVRQLFWRLTLMWGLLIAVKGAVSYWLLQSQSLVDFVLLKTIAISSLTALGAAATIWATVLTARDEHLFSRA